MLAKRNSDFSDWIERYRTEDKEVCVGPIEEVLISVNCLVMSSVIFAKDIFNEVGGFTPNIQGWDGYDLWLRIASKGVPFALLDQVTLKYRVTERGYMGPLMNRAYRTRECDAYALNSLVNRFPEYFL